MPMDAGVKLKERTNIMVKFRNATHEANYLRLLTQMKCTDEYHRALAYLFAVDEDCFRHIDDLFNFSEDGIKPQTALHHGWQTGTSVKTTRLAFNLWNGCCSDWDENGEAQPSRYFTPDEIFCSCLTPWYAEALKLRFPNGFG